jgi:hypothetical protein
MCDRIRRDPGSRLSADERPVMVGMALIVRRQDHRRCALIACTIRHYAEPEGWVIFDHRHKAAVGAGMIRSC